MKWENFSAFLSWLLRREIFLTGFSSANFTVCKFHYNCNYSFLENHKRHYFHTTVHSVCYFNFQSVSLHCHIYGKLKKSVGQKCQCALITEQQGS
jgi:hypothetical protein